MLLMKMVMQLLFNMYSNYFQLQFQMMVYIITDTNPHRIGAYNVLINIVDVNGDPLTII